MREPVYRVGSNLKENLNRAPQWPAEGPGCISVMKSATDRNAAATSAAISSAITAAATAAVINNNRNNNSSSIASSRNCRAQEPWRLMLFRKYNLNCFFLLNSGFPEV